MHSEKNLEISWKICICFVCQSYYRTRRLGVVRGSDFLEKIHQICWFSGCDFHLPIKKSSAIYAFWKNLGNFWRFCNFFVFSFGRLEFLSKGNGFLENIHQICWFSGCDFHLPAKKSSEIYAFWKKSGDFLKILHLFCAQKLLKNTPPRGGARQWFSGKNPQDLLVFWLWFSPPSEKIFSNLCILNKFWRFLCRRRRNDE